MRKLVLSVTFSVITLVTLGHGTSVSALDSSRDCDKYAIVNCGTMSTTEIKENYSKGDNDKVFSAFGIRKTDIDGDIRDGIVYRDGRVVVGGKTVATGAVMAARHLGGSAIAGSETAKKISVSAMSDAQTAFVKFDANGRFEWAIMKPCGNPVMATPPPAPKPMAECVSLSATPLSRDQYRLIAKASTKNNAKISSYTFSIKNNATIIEQRTVTSTSVSATHDTQTSLPAGTYTASVIVTTSEGNKTNANCTSSFRVTAIDTDIRVCELATKRIITIKESQFDSSKHSKNMADCTTTVVSITVCERATKRTVSIKESDFDSVKYSKNLNDCKVNQTTSPTLPETGMIDTVSKLFGATSLAGASAYYVYSRRF